MAQYKTMYLSFADKRYS